MQQGVRTALIHDMELFGDYCDCDWPIEKMYTRDFSLLLLVTVMNKLSIIYGPLRSVDGCFSMLSWNICSALCCRQGRGEVRQFILLGQVMVT